MRSRTAASNWQRTIGSIFPTDTGRTRSGSKAVTVRRIRSAIPRSEFERSRLDTRLALAGCHRERSLSWRQPGHGVAARRFGWVDGTKSAGAGGRAWSVGGRPSACHANGDSALRAAGYGRGMAGRDTDRRKPPRHRLRPISSCKPAPSKGAGADIAGATGALVVRRRARPWRGADAGTDLSRALPGSRTRPWPRSRRNAHQHQSRHGYPGRHRPRHCDDRRRRMLRMARVPVSRPEIHIAKLVQSGFGLGGQPDPGRRDCAGAQPGLTRKLADVLQRNLYSSAIKVSRSFASSGASVSRVIASAFGAAFSASCWPARVRLTSRRRPSSGSELVSVRPRAVRRSITPLMVATSIAVSRPSRFCEHGPVSVSFASAAHCVGVRLMPISRAKMVAWRCHTWRRMKPICSSRTYGGRDGFTLRLAETFLVMYV